MAYDSFVKLILSSVYHSLCRKQTKTRIESKSIHCGIKPIILHTVMQNALMIQAMKAKKIPVCFYFISYIYLLDMIQFCNIT